MNLTAVALEDAFIERNPDAINAALRAVSVI
jgi:hypothetical protein